MLTFTHSIGPDVRIRFSDKPEAHIRSMLKANGFRWSPVNREWWRTRIAGAADFLAALDRAIGPRRPDGACWECKAPEGYFRPYGAATPVYCDACYAKHLAAEKAEGRISTPYIDAFDLAYEDRCQEACGL